MMLRKMTMNRQLLLFITILLTASCSQKKEQITQKVQKPLIGKYLYIDNANVLHTKNGCKAVFKDRNMQMVNPVDPVCLSFESLNRVCSRCVTEEQIDSLSTLFSTYRQSYINVGNLHADLESRYDDIPPELKFRENLRDTSIVRQLYDFLVEENVMSGTLEEFMQWVGLSKPAKKKVDW